jgi:acyl-CoA thioesterase-1
MKILVMKAVVILLVALSVSACGPSEPAADAVIRDRPAPAAGPRTDPAPRPRIVFLGDSLTAGLGLPTPDRAFPARVQARLDREGYGFEVINAGVSGDTTAGGLRRLDWALNGDVRIVVIALGANDGLRGLSPAEMKRNLRQLCERSAAKGASVILAGMEAPPNLGPEYTAQFRAAYSDLASELKVPLLPFLLQGVAGDAALNQDDGIQPNEAGAARVAELIWPVLAPVVAQRIAR